LKKKIISLIIAQENIENIYISNKILIEQLLKQFAEIYILNLYNLKIFTKKNIVITPKNLPSEIKIINFKDSNEFKKFNIYHEIISILFIGKNPKYFKIHYLLKKFNIKLIMIMNLSQIGNKLSADIKLKYLLKAHQNYFDKGFYHLFRIFTVLNIFPKIDLLFESNSEVINYIKNSRSNKIEKLLPFLKIGYFREVIPVNSIYFDYMNILKKNKISKNNYITYIDTHFNHPDRTSREGKIKQLDQDNFYNKLKIFLKNISSIYKKNIIITKHPNNNSSHNFYQSFEISKIPTNEIIVESEIAIFTVSSAILNGVILKKKIININSSLLGDYMQNIAKQYVKYLGLVSYNIDKDILLKKEILEINLNKSIKNYDEYIEKKLIIDGNNMSSKKITETIHKNFF
jgi:hypothetical protein